MRWVTRIGVVECPPYSIIRETRGDWSAWHNHEAKYGVLKRGFLTAQAAMVYCEAHAKNEALA